MSEINFFIFLIFLLVFEKGEIFGTLDEKY